MNSIKLRPGNVLVAMLGMFLMASSLAKPLTTGFKDTDELLQQAYDLNAAVLAPSSWATAEKYYGAARRQAEAGRSETSRKSLVKANANLREAIEIARLAEAVLHEPLAARERAVNADAEQFEPALWEKAERQLVKAATRLEKGNRDSAQKEGARALINYSDAELAAIKTGIVGNARVLIAEAEASSFKVVRNAPITLSQARLLVAQAEAGLDSSRYETDKPKAEAALAEYQARHAMYIAGQVSMLNGRQLTAEELLLNMEQPLLKISEALQVEPDLSAGYQVTTAALVERAESLMALAAAGEPAQQDAQVANAAEITEAPSLSSRIAEVEALFGVNEAEIWLEGDDLVLRLVSLHFPSGQSSLQSQHVPVLSSVQKSLRLFPDSYIVVAGHVDKLGTEQQDMILSQKRANSVRSYLLRGTGLPATRISAEGYGASRPIAANSSAAGREQNRRVEVIIRQPANGTSSSRTARSPR